MRKQVVFLGGSPPLMTTGEKRRMSLMQWSVNYYTGLPEVDRQHEALFGLVNRLYDARGHRAEIIEQAFADLRDYVREHFSLEEKLMAESGLDAGYIARHRAAHENFIMRVDELWDVHRAGSDSAAEELLGFLMAWLREHILHTDRNMALDIHARMGTEAPHNQFAHF
jgi:hemerythrin